MMQLMSPENWLLIARLEREHQARSRLHLDQAPAAITLVQRIRQGWQQVARHQNVRACEGC